MLIVNADDLGRTCAATDNIVACYRKARITSASIMVFMVDSQRAAQLAAETGLETGLHLNLTQAFSGQKLPSTLGEQHLPIARYLRANKWSQIVYNPLLKKKLDHVFEAQYDEYCRLFAKEPAHINGHHHMHLCMNVILGHDIPRGSRVRRNFSFERGEKSIYNRFYRRLIDGWLSRHYCCTDHFFSLEASLNRQRLARIIDLAFLSNVELMMHPERAETFDFLMSSQFRDLIAEVPKGTYRMLTCNR